MTENNNRISIEDTHALSDDPDAPIRWSERDFTAAMAILERGIDEPADILVLSDEEIMAMDGSSRDQLVTMPFLEQESVKDADRTLIAGVALRSLIARHLITPVDIEGANPDDPFAPYRFIVDPDISGCMMLRRTAEVVVAVERAVAESVHRVYYYMHQDGRALEEEINASGMHMFTVLPDAEISGRVISLADPGEIAQRDGDAVVMSVDEFEEGGEEVDALQDTRSVTMLSAIDHHADGLKQVSLHMTTRTAFALQLDEKDEDSTVALREVSRTAIEELIEWFCERPESSPEEATEPSLPGA